MKHAFNKGVLSSKMAASLVSGGLLFAAGQAWALTDAGTDIKNKATVTYEDANGNSYSAQSNEAVVTVAEVYAGTLENDGNKSGAPGETVYFSHTLKNTGNATDTFTLDGLNGAGAAGSYQVFIDANGNGQPDAGESAATSVSVDAGDQVELILAVPVPSGTAAGATIDGTLLVRSTRGDGSFDANDGGLVQDIGTNGDAGTYDSDGVNGADGNDTNSDQVTVTTDAVLVTTKAASVDLTANTITYTLTVKNNGGRAATAVDIYDAVPANATFVDITTVNGLLASNGDTYEDNTGTDQNIPADATTMYTPAALASIDEPAGVDLDGDGTSGETGIPGIQLTDASLGVNTTVSVVYTVSFDPAAAAGTEIKNTFAAQGDLDGDNTPDTPVTSNTVTTVIGQTYAVDADDTEIAPDTTNDDVFNVASAASGAVVDFKHTITNNGNGNDVFELSVDTAGSTFPAGTTYSFWNAAGTVQITDTNGDGNPDTGSLAPGAANALNITVKADLPASASGAGPYAYTLTATSAGDNNQSDDTQGVLATINAAAVDLANSATAVGLGDSANDADKYTAGAPTTTNSAAVGATTSFSLFVANESGNPQSYTLGSALPSGWTVVFREVGIDTDGNGTLDNTANADTVVTATPNLPDSAVYHYTAEVKVSSSVAQAKADYTGADAVDGAGSATSPTDADGDYPVTFTVTSASDNGIFDRKLDAVDVIANRDISITPDGANQVQPGGNVDYLHVLSNDGNSTETVELSAANSNLDPAAPQWSNTTQLFVEGTGYVELSQLPVGTVSLRAPDGSFVSVEIVDADAATAGVQPEITLDAGEEVDVKVTVFAPANAPQGSQDTLTLSAVNADNAAGADASATASDLTDVILGQVRLNKTAGLDADCSCDDATPDWTADTGFAEIQTSKVEPDQCVIWNLTATNEGAATAKNVTISDETTPYTSFVAAKNSVRASDNNSVANSGTDPEVKWEIGDLPAGDNANAQFCVRVN